MYEIINQKINEDGTLKHIHKDGALYHVLHWDTQGTHCSEPNCEINKSRKAKKIDLFKNKF